MGTDVACARAEFSLSRGVGANATVGKEIAQSAKLWRVRYVSNVRLFRAEILLDFIVLFVSFLDHQCGGVAETTHVLQSLEDMLLVGFIRASHLLCEFFLFLLREVLEEFVLQFTWVTVVVLDDLRGQIVQDFLLETAEQEGKNLFVERFNCQCSCFLFLR